MIAKPTPLTPAHNVSGFDCGERRLTDWLKHYAAQSDASHHTKTFVITKGDGITVIGYFSFSIVFVEHVTTTPDKETKGLARYSIPVLLIGRIAVDSEFKGQGLGSRLLLFALKRAAQAANNDVPIKAVVIDAIDAEAKAFHSRFEFQAWPVDGLRMWLLMKDLLATLKA